MPRIAILQPFIPHYREEFFSLLSKDNNEVEIYVYEQYEKSRQDGFSLAETPVSHIASFSLFGLLFYNPLPLLRSNANTIVAMFLFSHVSTWFLLLTQFIHHKRIILWGQGISVKRYLQEEVRPDWKLKSMLSLADGAWIYMRKEADQWKKIFPRKSIVALNNTLSNISKMTSYEPDCSKEALKEKYGIAEEVIILFCARFTNQYRRADLLIETIQNLDPERYGFIIIGEGPFKPDFSAYRNVHDYNAVYDETFKRELFAVADVYFQPGWVGLSIVEAMANGKPIFTFKRGSETKQCVEYSYIQHGVNGLIFESIDECIATISSISNDEIARLGNNAKTLAVKELSVEQMVSNATSIL